VEDVAKAKQDLELKGIEVEEIRMDEFTCKKFTFFADPDDLPIEFYEQ
jgi:glyoxylase I family protein